MAFTTIDTVMSYLPNDVSVDETTHPTYAEVVSIWLPNYDGELNVAIGTGGGTLPVTDVNLLGWLDDLEAKKAAFDIMEARAKGSGNPTWQAEWIAAIAKLSDKEAQVAASVSLIGAPSAKTDVDPVFTKDRVW